MQVLKAQYLIAKNKSTSHFEMYFTNKYHFFNYEPQVPSQDSCLVKLQPIQQLAKYKNKASPKGQALFCVRTTKSSVSRGKNDQK